MSSLAGYLNTNEGNMAGSAWEKMLLIKGLLSTKQSLQNLIEALKFVKKFILLKPYAWPIEYIFPIQTLQGTYLKKVSIL